MKPNIITITISGKVQTGKSAAARSIIDMLEGHNYCVAVPDREERHNNSLSISNAPAHEKPNQDNTVFVIVEECE